LEYYIPKNTKMGSVMKSNSSTYEIHSYKYQDYGKAVYAPKNFLEESQYAEIIDGDTSGKNLQISTESSGHWGVNHQLVVPVTSPIKSVTKYWMYTKRDGEVILQWQKTEYHLDDGGVRVVKPGDGAFSLVTSALGANGAESSAVGSTSVQYDSLLRTEGGYSGSSISAFFVKFMSTLRSWFK
jgi:hypothetical protein